MFRRTGEDLRRAGELLASGVRDADAVSRLASEGIFHQRAEWLVQMARQERRAARAKRLGYIFLAVAVLALFVGVPLAAWFASERVAFLVLGVIGAVALLCAGLVRYEDRTVPSFDWDPRGNIPDELLTSAPRQVRVSKTPDRRVRAEVAGGVALLLFGLWQAAGLWILRDRGVEIEGRVVSASRIHIYGKVSYTFASPSGARRSSSIVPWSVYRRLQSGDAIVVTFWDRFPTILNRPFPRAQIDIPLAVKIAGLQIFCGLFITLFGPRIRRAIQRQMKTDEELAKDGTAVVGEIVEYTPGFFKVRYRFRIGSRAVESESNFRTSPGFPPKPGDRVVIVYNPADSSRNVPADSLDVEFA